MRYSKSAAALVAALSISSAVASPTHRHAHRHEKRDTSNDKVNWASLDWNKMGVDWAAAYSSGLAEATQAAATPTPSSVSSVAPEPTSAAPSASASASASASSSDSVNAASVTPSTTSLWKNLVGIANNLKEFGSEVAAKGSTGDFYWGNYGSPYGHNMLLVSSREGYAYTNKFINTSGKDITVVIWNKVGPDIQVLSGSALAPTKPTITFALAPGKSQIVAFQENSQVGWAEAVDEFAASGAFATSWGEVNFVKSGSGYDLSAIMNPHNNNYNMSISSTEAPHCTSDPTQNYWLTATQPIGNSDGSCYIAQNTATLTTLMGGTF